MSATHEVDRQAAVHRYAILDTPPDGTFDSITAIAASIFDVPIAIVSIVDHDRIWFKSHHGLEIDAVDRAPGLCASAILSDEPYIINDAKIDPRALANPLVAGDFGLRFYAAAPLKTSDGFNLGTLCVIDKKPRQTSDKQMRMLQSLAAVVMDELELRLAARNVVQLSEQLQARTQLEKRDAEQRFQQAFDNAPIGMALLSPELAVIEVNAAFCDMLGHREVDILLKSITDLIALGDIALWQSAVAGLATGGARNHKTKLHWQSIKGRRVWSRVTLASVVDTLERPVRFILQVEDITDRNAL